MIITAVFAFYLQFSKFYFYLSFTYLLLNFYCVFYCVFYCFLLSFTVFSTVSSTVSFTDPFTELLIFYLCFPLLLRIITLPLFYHTILCLPFVLPLLQLLVLQLLLLLLLPLLLCLVLSLLLLLVLPPGLSWLAKRLSRDWLSNYDVTTVVSFEGLF